MRWCRFLLLRLSGSWQRRRAAAPLSIVQSVLLCIIPALSTLSCRSQPETPPTPPTDTGATRAAPPPILVPVESQVVWTPGTPLLLLARPAASTADAAGVEVTAHSLAVFECPPTGNVQTFRWSDDGLCFADAASQRSGRTVHFLEITPPEGFTGGTFPVNGREVAVETRPAPESQLGPAGDWLAPEGPSMAWPDADSPLEAFRRHLLASRAKTDLESREPADAVVRTVARHNALRWHHAMDRLRSVSPGVADELRSLLTRTCRDGALRFAAWPADAADLAELDALLHEPRNWRQPGRDSALTTLDWIEGRPTTVVWVEDDHGPQVHLALANLGPVEVEAGLAWLDSPFETARVRLPPGQVTRTVLPRPPDVIGPPTLTATVSGREPIQVPLGPGEVLVRPPGVALPRPARHWTLPDWLAGSPRPEEASRATRVFLTRRDGLWRLDIDCAAPAEALGTLEADLAEPGDLAGVEAVTLFVGPYPEAAHIVTIGPDGSIHTFRGEGPGENQIEVMQRAGGWAIRLTVPPEWISAEARLDFGVLRTHHNLPEASCSPRPALPWRADPGRWRFRLDRWDVW